jgi:hypothetical protein
MKRALRRAASSRRLFVLAALLLVVAPVGGTWAFFAADTTSATSQFTGGWVGEASGLSTPTVTGLDASMNWTKATHLDTLTSQTLTYADQNTSSTCNGASYSNSIGSIGTVASYTTSGFTSALNGHYVCFKLVSNDNNWSSSGVVFPIVHLGLFPIAYASANGGTLNQADANDTITITFDQNLAASSLPASGSTIDVCFLATMIVVGDTSGCSNTSDAYTIGQINGISNTRNFDADQSIITVANATISIVLGTSHNGVNAHSGTMSNVASSTFTAATTIKSSATTDQASACTASANGCVPTATAGSGY